MCGSIDKPVHSGWVRPRAHAVSVAGRLMCQGETWRGCRPLSLDSRDTAALVLFLRATPLASARPLLTGCPPPPAVIYKTSLLHLQPRQMTIYLPEVRKISMDSVNLPVFNPNVFSEDEDDLPGVLSNIRSLVISPRPLLVGRDGAQRVSSRGFQRVPVCLLPRLAKVWCLSKVGRCVRCHGRKVTRWHWSGKAGSYQSKDAGGGCDAALHRALLPSSHHGLDKETLMGPVRTQNLEPKSSLSDPRPAPILSIPAQRVVSLT